MTLVSTWQNLRGGLGVQSHVAYSGGRIFFSTVNFVYWLCVRSIPVLPQWHLKDLGHSAKSAGGRLHLNTLTSLIQQSRAGLTVLSRHGVGTYQGNELTCNSSGNSRPQLSQLTELQVENESSHLPLESSQAKRRDHHQPFPPPLPFVTLQRTVWLAFFEACGITYYGRDVSGQAMLWLLG